jgi:hypothetical protein
VSIRLRHHRRVLECIFATRWWGLHTHTISCGTVRICYHLHFRFCSSQNVNNWPKQNPRYDVVLRMFLYSINPSEGKFKDFPWTISSEDFRKCIPQLMEFTGAVCKSVATLQCGYCFTRRVHYVIRHFNLQCSPGALPTWL